MSSKTFLLGKEIKIKTEALSQSCPGEFSTMIQMSYICVSNKVAISHMWLLNTQCG